METTNEQSSKKKPKVSSFLKGTILTDEHVTSQFPFIIFLVFLGFLMITNRYRSEKVIKQIVVLQDSIDGLRSQSISNSVRLMNLSRPSEVVQKVQEAGLGLEESSRAPQQIEVKKLR